MRVRCSLWIPTPTCFRTCKRKLLPRWKRHSYTAFSSNSALLFLPRQPLLHSRAGADQGGSSCLVNRCTEPLPNIRLYDLRHTAATLALTVGVSPKVLSEQLGHTTQPSLWVCIPMYCHTCRKMRRRKWRP